jgi:hypothetical protein
MGSEFSQEEIEHYRQMTGEQRLEIALRMSDEVRERAREALRRGYPQAEQREINRMFRERVLLAYEHKESLGDVFEEMSRIKPDA